MKHDGAEGLAKGGWKHLAGACSSALCPGKGMIGSSKTGEEADFLPTAGTDAGRGETEPRNNGRKRNEAFLSWLFKGVLAATIVCFPLAASAEESRSHAVATWVLDVAEGIADGPETGESTQMFGDLYGEIAPGTIPERFAKKVADLNKTAAKRNGIFRNMWISRKPSTFWGSISRVTDDLEKVQKMQMLGKIAIIGVRGILEKKSAGEVVDDLVASGIGAATYHGEAAYWSTAIVVGMMNGRTFAEAVGDAFDPKTAGTWSKTGWGLGYWWVTGFVKLERWMGADERKKLEQTMLANLREAGYGEEAEAALRKWLAMDLDERARHPFKFKDEWLVESTATAEPQVCKEPVEKPKRQRTSKPAGQPCMSCMFGDLSGVCSTPSCPNYGHPHREFKW